MQIFLAPFLLTNVAYFFFNLSSGCGFQTGFSCSSWPQHKPASLSKQFNTRMFGMFNFNQIFGCLCSNRLDFLHKTNKQAGEIQQWLKIRKCYFLPASKIPCEQWFNPQFHRFPFHLQRVEHSVMSVKHIGRKLMFFAERHYGRY